MNCILYARVSTDRQAEKDLSIPAQLRLMRDYARQQGWTVAEELTEPGMTATNAERPVLQQLLQRITDGVLKVDVVLAHKLNRLARNLDDYVPIRAALWKHGVRLAYVVERIDESASGRLLENLMASIAQFESANLSEETKKGMRERVLRGGWPHRPPRGYVMVRRTDGEQKGSRVEIHPREGPLIAEAFSLFATGQLSVDTVSKKLAAKGVISASGTPLSHSYLHRILTNPFYLGRIHWKELKLQGKHQPLVDTETFERVQRTIRDRFVRPLSYRTSVGFPLKGLARCARCRGHLTAERHGAFGYYRCSRQANRHAACDARYCRADRAHQDVMKLLKTLQLSRQTADLIRQEASKLIEQRTKEGVRTRRDLDRRLTETMKAETQMTEAFLAGHLSSSLYQQKCYELRSERTRLERQAAALTASTEVLHGHVGKALDFSTSLFDLYEQFSDLRRGELLKAAFSGIVLGADGLVGFTLRPPFDALATAATVGDQTLSATHRREAASRIIDTAA